MKSVTLKGTWFINAPMKDVYRVITDFEAAPKYFPRLARHVKITARKGNQLQIEAVTKPFRLSTSFRVEMQTTLHPPRGFESENISRIGVEHERVELVEVSDGTEYRYYNRMEISNRLVRPLANVLIGKLAFRFWEKLYLSRLRELVE